MGRIPPLRRTRPGDPSTTWGRSLQAPDGSPRPTDSNHKDQHHVLDKAGCVQWCPKYGFRPPCRYLDRQRTDRTVHATRGAADGRHTVLLQSANLGDGEVLLQPPIGFRVYAFMLAPISNATPHARHIQQLTNPLVTPRMAPTATICDELPRIRQSPSASDVVAAVSMTRSPNSRKSAVPALETRLGSSKASS